MTRARVAYLVRRSRAVTVLFVLLFATLVQTVARAGEPVQHDGLQLSAVPIFGEQISSGSGFTELVVAVDNANAEPFEGEVFLESVPYSHLLVQAPPARLARAPLRLAPGGAVRLRIPFRPTMVGYGTMSVRVESERGDRSVETNVATTIGAAAVIVEIAESSRLRGALNDWPLEEPCTATMRFQRELPIQVTTAQTDPRTGDFLLPDRGAYDPATLVLVRSEVLGRLTEAQRASLFSWVHGGGTLAVVPTRPEDLRGGPLEALVGGPIVQTDAPVALLTYTALERVDPLEAPPSPDARDDDGLHDPFGGKGTQTRTTGVGPTDSVRRELRGFEGGRLAESPYGAAASYGLGRVHLLAFDPSRASVIEDGWTRGRLVALVEDALARRIEIVTHSSTFGGEGYALVAAGRLVDPNVGSRAGLAVAATVLVLYSVVVCLLLLRRSRPRGGTPLRGLIGVPLASAAAFVLVVAVGVVSKGVSGKARRLAIAEAISGDGTTSVRMLRGFFTRGFRELRPTATTDSGLLGVPALGNDRAHGTLEVGRDTLALSDLPFRPWETVLVHESGGMRLGDGVVVSRANGSGAVVVQNRSGRTLRDLVVWEPGRGLVYLPELADGATARSSDGTIMRPAKERNETHCAGTRNVHALEGALFSTELPADTGRKLAEAWGAVELALGMLDWMPDGRAAVLATVEGGTGAAEDSGLRVERDTLLLRVLEEAPR
jgi:hypothetical protein